MDFGVQGTSAPLSDRRRRQAPQSEATLRPGVACGGGAQAGPHCKLAGAAPARRGHLACADGPGAHLDAPRPAARRAGGSALPKRDH